MTKVEELARMLRNCPVSVAELSRRSGVSRPAILDIRDGITANPGIQTVERIERALLTVAEDTQPTSDERAAEAGADSPGESDGATRMASESDSASHVPSTEAEGAHNPTSAVRREAH